MTPEIVNSFHAVYIKETGMPISLGFDRQRAWFDLLRRNYGEPPAPLTHDDLRLVIASLRRGIAKGERNAGCLRFRNLIMQPDFFEEELAMARRARSQQRRTRDQATQDTRAAAEAPEAAAPVESDADKAIRAAGVAHLRACRKGLRGGGNA